VTSQPGDASRSGVRHITGTSGAESRAPGALGAREPTPNRWTGRKWPWQFSHHEPRFPLFSRPALEFDGGVRAAVDWFGKVLSGAVVNGGALVAGAVAGLGIAVPVGAIATYLVGLAARARLAVAASAALGVATTDGAYALIAATGGVGLQNLVRPLAGPLTVLAAVVLVGLGARIAWTGVRRYLGGTGPDPVDAQAPSAIRTYIGLVMLTAVNPTTVIYFLALVVGQQGTGAIRGSWDVALLFGLGALLASALWQLLLVGGGAALGRAVTGGRGQLLIAVTSGAIMLVLALQVLVPR
jgi:arginine exporter protein ArgO